MRDLRRTGRRDRLRLLVFEDVVRLEAVDFLPVVVFLGLAVFFVLDVVFRAGALPLVCLAGVFFAEVP
jgi:hypothetical protein